MDKRKFQLEIGSILLAFVVKQERHEKSKKGGMLTDLAARKRIERRFKWKSPHPGTNALDIIKKRRPLAWKKLKELRWHIQLKNPYFVNYVEAALTKKPELFYMTEKQRKLIGTIKGAVETLVKMKDTNRETISALLDVLAEGREKVDRWYDGHARDTRKQKNAKLR